MQYSKRPSPLSLFKVKDAREQNRLLWLGILPRLRDRPGSGPGWSCSARAWARTPARTCSCTGARWAEALGIDRALWIGTPYGSGGCTGDRPDRLDVDRTRRGGQRLRPIRGARPGARLGVRYVLLSHDNDGVTKFGPDLLARRRLAGPTPTRAEPVAGGSPRGIPASMRWRPITTFFQTLIDMKNAQIPGAYRALAHDYRPDLARFVGTVSACRRPRSRWPGSRARCGCGRRCANSSS